MQYIPIQDVIVPENRQRQKFNKKKLEELCDSIQKPIGLLHSIILRDDGTTLVCGERRLIRNVTPLCDGSAE
jgi:ParB-like chromosome segregation protein Spo0J